MRVERDLQSFQKAGHPHRCELDVFELHHSQRATNLRLPLRSHALCDPVHSIIIATSNQLEDLPPDLLLIHSPLSPRQTAADVLSCAAQRWELLIDSFIPVAVRCHSFVGSPKGDL